MQLYTTGKEPKQHVSTQLNVDTPKYAHPDLGRTTLLSVAMHIQNNFTLYQVSENWYELRSLAEV